MSPDPSLVDRLGRHGQEHLLGFWDRLDEAEQASLAAELGAIDFDRLDDLVRRLVAVDAAEAPSAEAVEAIPVDRLPHTDGERAARRQVADLGASAIAAGEVGVILVAGGSGTRLGFEGPKGTYPIGPVSGASLFQIHAEKIAAAAMKHGKAIPLYVMTSPDNHEVTARFFAEHNNFGLERVRFFVQGRMPAVDRETGKILLAAPGRVALSPDGHGGTLAALAAVGPDGGSSCLEEMKALGVRTLFYFQVDNPMVRIADPAFVGLHRQADAEMSFKVIEKQAPDEKLGVVVLASGKPRVIEYSDLPPALAERRSPDGSLELWAGSIAVHILERSFIERLVRNLELPYHRAIKAVSYVDESGRVIQPSGPNAVKFETFIFDALPLAARFVLVECDRAVEFEPLKNATGPDSPETVRRRMSDQFADWLESAGAAVPRRADGSSVHPIEISPLYAPGASELKAKVAPGLVVDGPLRLE